MENRIFRCFAPFHSPIFGIDPANLTDRIHGKNWNTRAVSRLCGGGPFYVYIARGWEESGARKTPKYGVLAWSPERHRHEPRFTAVFDRLRDAIACANGESPSELRRGTSPPPAGYRFGSFPPEVSLMACGCSGGNISPILSIGVPAGEADAG